MTAYYFQSKHPKFKVEFPTDASKSPPKHPNSIRKNSLFASLEDVTNHNEELNTFMKVWNNLLLENIQSALRPPTLLLTR